MTELQCCVTERARTEPILASSNLAKKVLQIKVLERSHCLFAFYFIFYNI